MANNQKVVLENKSLDDIDIGDGIVYCDDNLTTSTTVINADTLQGKTVQNITDTLNSSVQTQINNSLALVSGKTELLYGGRTTWITSSFSLSKPFTDYDLICFVYSHSGENAAVAVGSSYVDCKIYPSLFLKNLLDAGTGALALFGYSTRFAKYQVTSTTTFTYVRNGDSGTIGIIAVYGIKV